MRGFALIITTGSMSGANRARRLPRTVAPLGAETRTSKKNNNIYERSEYILLFLPVNFNLLFILLLVLYISAVIYLFIILLLFIYIIIIYIILLYNYNIIYIIYNILYSRVAYFYVFVKYFFKKIFKPTVFPLRGRKNREQAPDWAVSLRLRFELRPQLRDTKNKYIRTKYQICKSLV